jgi:hypothetical protein
VTGAVEFTVTGGAGGIRARFDDMHQAAGLLRGAGGDLLEMAAGAQRLLADPNVAASAVLNPGGAAGFEAAMAAALDGPRGLLVAALAVQSRGQQLEAAVLHYEATEQANAALLSGRRQATGSLLTAGAPLAPLIAPLLVGGGLGWLTSERISGRDPAADLQRHLTDHPGIVDEIMGTSPGVLNALVATAPLATAFRLGADGYPFSQEEVAGMVAGLYTDGTAEVTRVDEAPTEAMTAVPAGIGGLLEGLAFRNKQTGGEAQGQIDVRVVTVAEMDGDVRRSYIVDLPGTKDWQFDPTADRPYPNDLGTNVRLMAGDPSLRTDAVATALQLAGARPSDPVMLIGHSQGGMLAMRAADQFTREGRYNVTNVITAGSPVARMPVPDYVQVLSLENAHDIVPHLDGQPNPDQPNRITITFAEQRGAIGFNHDMGDLYSPAGHRLDHSLDPSLDVYRQSLQGRFIFADDAPEVTVQAYVYDVKRGL